MLPLNVTLSDNNLRGAILLSFSWISVAIASLVATVPLVTYIPVLFSTIASIMAIRHYWLADKKPKKKTRVK